jgi:preprotein translocase subunit SecG
LSGRGAGSVLTRTTAILAAVFFATSITLALLAGTGRQSRSILDTPATSEPAPPPAGPSAPASSANPNPQPTGAPATSPPAPAPAPAPATESPAEPQGAQPTEREPSN